MKKTLILSVFITSCMLLLGGCEKEDSSLCPQLVNFVVGCYESRYERPPPDTEVTRWRNDCEVNPHSDSCINCAMDQTCDDYLDRSDYVYNTLCADRCP